MVDENAVNVHCDVNHKRYINIKLDKTEVGGDYEVWFNDAWHRVKVRKDRIYIDLGRVEYPAVEVYRGKKRDRERSILVRLNQIKENKDYQVKYQEKTVDVSLWGDQLSIKMYDTPTYDDEDD